MHPVISTPHVFIEARSVLQGSGFVMSTDSPFNLGRVLTFKDNDAFLSNLGNSAWPVVSVAGYRILIQFAGSLVNGKKLQLTEPDMSFIDRELAGMAEFFYSEKIAPHSGYYRRFLI